jgi:hypothetical protein
VVIDNENAHVERSSPYKSLTLAERDV